MNLLASITYYLTYHHFTNVLLFWDQKKGLPSGQTKISIYLWTTPRNTVPFPWLFNNLIYKGASSDMCTSRLTHQINSTRQKKYQKPVSQKSKTWELPCSKKCWQDWYRFGSPPYSAIWLQIYEMPQEASLTMSLIDPWGKFLYKKIYYQWNGETVNQNINQKQKTV